MTSLTLVILSTVLLFTFTSAQSVQGTSYGTTLNPLVRYAPKTCTLFDGKKKYIGCKHVNIKLGFGHHIGSLSGKLKIEFGKVILSLTAAPGSTIFQAAISPFLVGQIPPFPDHKDLVKYCHGKHSIVKHKPIQTLLIPMGKKNCCKSMIFVTGKITLCDSKMTFCATKQFFKGVKISCVNICAGQGKHVTPGPMSATEKCPTCK